jgi:heptosyltransferase-2
VDFKDFLIVRLAALGDVARATSLVQRIRTEHPASRITWVVGTEALPLIQLVPGISRVVAVDERRIFTGNRFQQVAETFRLWLRLLGRRFDRTILGHPDERFRWLLLGVRAGDVRVLPEPARGSRQYIGDEFAQLLGDRPVRPGEFPLADLRESVEAIALPHGAHLGDDPTVLLVPGGARNVARDDPLRRWPLERYVELARTLIANGHRVILIGGASDAWVREAFDGTGAEDFIGALTIPQLLRVMHEADAVVSHDTGPIHLAQLVRARVIALFGPTVPERVAGRSDNVVSLWGGAHLACRPCYDGRSYAPCTRNLCMEDISVRQVLDVIAPALSAPR